MADQFTLIEAPLVGGIDQRTDARKVPGVRLLTGTNVQIDKAGAYGKRFGTVTKGTPTASGSKVFEYDGELVAAGASNVYARCDSSTYSWKTKDFLPEVTDVVARTVAATSAGAYLSDVAYYSAGDLLVYCWATASSSADVYALIVERATGHVVSGPTKVTTSANAAGPRIVICGATAVIAWHSGGANIPGVRSTLSSSSPTWDSPTNITTDSQSTNLGVFDMHAIDSTNFLFAYERNAGTNRCRLAKITASTLAIVGSALDLTDSTNSRQAISIDVQAGERSWVSYVYIATGNLVVKAAIVNETAMTETVAPATVESVASGAWTGGHLDIVRLSSTQASVTWWAYVSSSTSDHQFRGATINTSCAVVGSVRYLGWSLRPLSRQFVQGGKAYQLVHTIDMAPTATLSQILVDVFADDTSTSGLQARACAVVSPRYASSNTAIHGNQGHLANCVNPTSGEWRTLGAEGISDFNAVTGGVNGVPFVTDYKFTFDYKKRMAAELGGLLYLSGGVPMWFDGQRAAEVGYFAAGKVASLTSASVGGGSLVVGQVYGYQSCFAQRDAKGNMHRSAADAAASVTIAGGHDSASGTISYYTLTARYDPANTFGGPKVETYRTKQGGNVYYRRTTESNATTNDATDADGVFSMSDTTDDSTIGANEIIYTQGAPTLGQLDNVCPPSASILIVHRDRIVLAGCPNREQVWLSKKFVPGYAPGFNEALVFTIDDGGDITGLASMDGRLIVFKTDRIFYIDGDGPDNLGQNNDWGSPTRVNGTVGCIEPRSIVVTPIGIVFQSRVGLSLLDRSLNVVADWGDPVQYDLAAYGSVTYAVLHPTRTEIRIGIADPNTLAAELRYDYRAKAWFKALYTDSGGNVYPVSAASVGSDYVLAMSTGEVFREATTVDATTYLDDSDTYVTRTLEFAPVSAAGTLGYQNVAEIMFLCEHHTAHETTLAVAVDDGSYAETKTWTAAETSAMDSVHELSIKPLRGGKCRMITARLTDATPSSGSVGTGRGFSLCGLTFKVAQKEGPYKLLGSTQKG